MYDIAIIGLGPAGASFARLVDSQRYRVVALDRKDAQLPGGFRKPCGGLLSPKAQRALAKFNLSIPGHIVASPQIFYVKTIDMDHHLQRNYQRFYLNINRHRFDLWLMSLIPNTVTVYDRSSVTQIDDTGGVYTITFFRGKKKETVRARYLIDAGGALSIVSRKFLDKDMAAYRLSIQEWSLHHSQSPFFSCLFDSQKRVSCPETKAQRGRNTYQHTRAPRGLPCVPSAFP
jgi:flavin-dependent dehydrogenase